MEDHHNGVNSTEELETLISDNGVLFREYRGDGFMVVGDENIFIVKDHEENGKGKNPTEEVGIEFSEVNAEHIHELHAEENRPEHRLEMNEDAERVDNGNQKPSTEIKLFVSNHTLQFYVQAEVHKVAAAFVNFRNDNGDSNKSATPTEETTTGET